MKAGLKASGKVVDVLFSPLRHARAHAGTENIFSFSLFHRSIEKGKEGKGGRLKSNLPSEPIIAAARYGRHINRGLEIDLMKAIAGWPHSPPF